MTKQSAELLKTMISDERKTIRWKTENFDVELLNAFQPIEEPESYCCGPDDIVFEAGNGTYWPMFDVPIEDVEVHQNITSFFSPVFKELENES